MCPFSSKWSNAISALAFPDDVGRFLSMLRDYARQTGIPEQEIDSYLGSGAWKARAGGRALKNGGVRVVERDRGDSLDRILYRPRTDWREWIKILGVLNMRSDDSRGTLDVDHGPTLSVDAKKHEDSLELVFGGFTNTDAVLKSYVKRVLNKAVYCSKCGACEVECPTGALKVYPRVDIDENLCIHCMKCVSFSDKGCLAAASLAVTEGGKGMKGLSKYQTFGMKTAWLDEFLRDPDTWLHKNSLGPRQFQSMKCWLKDAGLIDGMRLTPLGERIRRIGSGSLLTWSVIWSNLSYASDLVRWYVTSVPWSESLAVSQMVVLFPERVNERTRKNALSSLYGLLEGTPLGREMGLGAVVRRGKVRRAVHKFGWTNPDPISVLYAMYVQAEHEGNYDTTLTNLFDDRCSGGPHVLFGIGVEEMKRILRGLAARYPEWVTVDLVRDLDNIFLNRSRRSEEALDLEQGD